MTMLGAQLDDLAQLSTRLTTTSGDIEGTNGRCTSATTNVVDALRSSAQSALNSVSAEMSALRATVTAAQNSASNAVWTGGNSDRFKAAYDQFNGAMASAEQTTNQTFTEFSGHIERMTEQLHEYVSSFAAALTRAQQATASMSQAVSSQHNSLEHVMNSGLTIG
jgi:hypothetical protein